VDSHPYDSPFTGAAAYYDRFRAPYAPEALEYAFAAFGDGEDARALDLGCGPGTLAIPLSRRFAEVVAVDADGGMIAEAKRLAKARGRRNIRWLRRRAEDVSSDLGAFRLATLGQSFHWMDRDRVLSRLAKAIEDGGGLAFINPGRRRPQESWEDIAGEIVSRYLGARGRHPGMNVEPKHEPALLRSTHFCRFTTCEFASVVERDIPSIVGCLYSTSGAAKPLFGDSAPAFEADLKAALLRLRPSGRFEERLETEVLLAPRVSG